MPIYKALGSVFILVAGFYFSKNIKCSCNDRIKSAEALYDLICYIRGKISSFCMPFSDILSGVERGKLDSLGFSEPYPASAFEFYEAFEKRSDGELYDIVESFFKRERGASKDDEIKNCDIALEKLSLLIEKRSDDKKTKEKTVPIISFAVSVGIILLLL